MSSVKSGNSVKNNFFVLSLLAATCLASAPVHGMQESASEQQAAPEQMAPEDQPVYYLLHALNPEHCAQLAGHAQNDLENAAKVLQTQRMTVHKDFAELVTKKRLQPAMVAQQQAEPENGTQDTVLHEQERKVEPEQELEYEIEQKYVIGLVYALGARQKDYGKQYDEKKQKDMRSAKWARCAFIATVLVSAGLVSFGYAVPCMPKLQ